MEAMRSTWTDSRLDDLRANVDSRFDDLKQETRDLKQSVTTMDERLTGRMDDLQHTILLVGGGILAAFITVLAAMLGLIATQL